MNVKFYVHLRILQLMLPACLFLTACQREYTRNKSHQKVSYSSIEKGEKLAAMYCQSCHLLPDPALLNSQSWDGGVLPNMGPRLGIFNYNLKPYPSSKYDRDLDTNFYPKAPLLKYEEWQNIIDYYTATSPDVLPEQQKQNQISVDTSAFKIIIPSFSYPYSSTSFLSIDTFHAGHRIILSDVSRQNTSIIDQQLNIIDSMHNSGPVVNFERIGAKLLACDIGVMNPNNGRFGKALLINEAEDGKYKEEDQPLFDSLQRPVQITPADFNNDGKSDYLVCEFGFITGALSWMENMGNKKYTRHILRPLPGAIKAYVNDYNHDGLQDFMVLFAQGDESIILFTNKGNGNFAQEKLLSFPPSYGSSYFELADFNKDGYPDIVYTCGDNADYSPVLKPYHGVYVFINDKTNHFEQKFFYPINGCYKAMARDFDGDGDLDIATISFFADYTNQPEEGFVYFRNMGGLHFQPLTVPGTEKGRWLTMDAGDFDGDGKADIVLGNFSIGPILHKPKTEWQKGPPFILLKNISK
ncbi:MAG: VCBS repeat-containing protein [Ginsengibacter sp.]